MRLPCRIGPSDARCEASECDHVAAALRSIDLRESTVEMRLASMIEGSLDPGMFTQLARTPVGKHLGCYNWLRLDTRHAPARAYALSRLPAMASFFADSLITLETLTPAELLTQPDDDAQAADDAMGVALDAAAGRPRRAAPDQVPTLDLRNLAARSDTAHSLRWGSVLKRAIDAGQDRAIIEALAQRFAVGDNVIRRVWRDQPRALGVPPTWHLAQILLRLNELPERGWPQDNDAWQELIAAAVPAQAA